MFRNLHAEKICIKFVILLSYVVGKLCDVRFFFFFSDASKLTGVRFSDDGIFYKNILKSHVYAHVCRYKNVEFQQKLHRFQH